MPTEARRTMKARVAKAVNRSDQINDERLRVLVEGASDYAIITLDPQGVVTTWNRGAERITAYRPEEIIGRHIACLYPHDKIEAGCPEQELKVATVQGRFEDDNWRVRKDGSRFWANVVMTPLHDREGHLFGFGKIMRDLTERRRGEERLRLVVESAPNAMLLTNDAGIIVLINSQTERLFGYSRNELIGQPVEILVPERVRGAHPSDRATFFADPQARPMGAGRDLYAVHKDGHEIPVEIGLSPMATEEGTFVLASIIDITERKRAEATIARQAQEILEVATPVVQVWDGVVVAPLIGTLDSQRTEQFMERLLQRIVDTNSPVALVDITGVPTIDTQTAQHLIETITAVRMLGAQTVLTGVRPALAQTLVHLGIDLSHIVTRSSLSAGLRVALDMLDLQVVRKNGRR
ncbi:MAG TPA: PAS domain S-box protein [Alphaproteobacteria bacterium]|nr:PAS domain S-box protein [Alphaproteobacteria bacterium]